MENRVTSVSHSAFGRSAWKSRFTRLAGASDGYPSSAITLPGVMPSLKYRSTALRLCSILNTTDSNPDAHTSNIPSAPPNRASERNFFYSLRGQLLNSWR